MRLTQYELSAIQEEVYHLDASAKIYLFGSRTNDDARGGDIDLLVLSDTLDFRDVLRLRISILDRIGWQQLDVILRKPNDTSDDFMLAIVKTGVQL